MDFTQIWEQIQALPFAELIVQAVQALVLIVTAIKAYIVFKSSKANAQSTLNLSTAKMETLGGDLKTIVKNAFPEKMKIDVSELIDERVQDALADIKAEIMKSVTAELKSVANKQDLTLQSLACLKSIPDSLKNEIQSTMAPKAIERSITIPLIVSEVATAKKAEAVTTKNVPID